ncbi:hypothetical protein NKR23_g11025 [Pleurostoma richardsiae]|uniref:Uncharacterized protein n=1 Tax=Pleurostoma richardsiae TaxID=41990 RepID=A0AA38RKI6_9PEZI|nr:hypothetical protein NKR23_g11025 [Pleurostoma richardsiae]
MARLDSLTDDDCMCSSLPSEDDLFDDEDKAFSSTTKTTDVERLDDASDNDDVEDDKSVQDRMLNGNDHPHEYCRFGD